MSSVRCSVAFGRRCSYARAIRGGHTVSRSPHQSVTGACTSASSKPQGRPRYASSRASHRPPSRNDSARPRAYASSVAGSPVGGGRALAPLLEAARGDTRCDPRDLHDATHVGGQRSHAVRRRHRRDERNAAHALRSDGSYRERMRAAGRPTDHAEPLDVERRDETLRPLTQRPEAHRPARTDRPRADAHRARPRCRRRDGARAASRRRRAGRRPAARSGSPTSSTRQRETTSVARIPSAR